MNFIFNSSRLWVAGALVGAAFGCGSSAGGDEPPQADTGVPTTLIAASDVPIDGLSHDDVLGFDDGDGLFGLAFRPVDGLGPLFIRTSCGACHAEGARGPGLVQKMSMVETDGITPSIDQSVLAFGHTIRQGLAAGAKTPILAPVGPGVKVSIRLGPPVLGRGYMEAVSDAEIERVAAEQAARTDGIHGRINRVVFASVPNTDKTFFDLHTGDTVIGRFGLKARIATLDEFTADAFQGDMGMTNPMRPDELPNPDGLTDDLHAGVDVDLDYVNRVAFYLRRIAIPRRVGLTDQGKALFESTKCSVCHVPSLKTRADYPIRALADIDAPIFTDLLLHDLGDALSDGMTDGTADSRAWRTTPLIGLRFNKTLLHDGRVTNITDAILAHDGEARTSIDLFRALTDSDRAALVSYVSAL